MIYLLYIKRYDYKRCDYSLVNPWKDKEIEPETFMRLTYSIGYNISYKYCVIFNSVPKYNQSYSDHLRANLLIKILPNIYIKTLLQ